MQKAKLVIERWVEIEPWTTGRQTPPAWTLYLPGIQARVWLGLGASWTVAEAQDRALALLRRCQPTGRP